MIPTDRERLVEALDYAISAHGDQVRKGKSVPYVSHLLQVAGMVLEHGGGVNQAIAGLLHDTLEDCERASEAEIRERFGGEVARIVASCTDLLEDDRPDSKSSWPVRKARYVEHLKRCDADTRLVAACDKLHNLSDLVADIRTSGLATLERFNATLGQTLWYQQAVRSAAGDDLPETLRLQWDARLDELRRRIETEAGAVVVGPDAGSTEGNALEADR